MKILFLQDLWYEWQAPMQLSALARQNGHECMLIIDADSHSATKKALKYMPDLIVFSVITGSHWYALETARKIKDKARIPILAGGPHPTLCPEMIEDDSIDFICRGEGDLCFVMLLDRINSGGSLKNIPNLWYKSDNKVISNNTAPLVNIDELPFLDRELYYNFRVFRNEKTRYFYISRGCKYDCTYCCVPAMRCANGSGPRLRLRSPGLICREVKETQSKYGINHVFFQDDTLAQDRDWALEFLDRYTHESGIPFLCMLRAGDLDESIVAGLYKAQCRSVLLTVDTGDENLRKALLGRDESNEQFLSAVSLLKKYKIKTSTLNMFGFPGDNQELAKRTVDFNRMLNVDYPWAMLYRPFPNTRLEQRAIDMGLIKPEESRWSKEKNLYKKSLLLQRHSEQMENLQKLFHLAVKHPWVYNSFFLDQKWASGLYYSVFCLYSFYREIKLWEKSALLTLITGLKNYL